MSSYCNLFGKHKRDPCPCGWSSKNDIECFIERSIAEIEQMMVEAKDPKHGEGYRQFLNGLFDGFSRVKLFLETRGK